MTSPYARPESAELDKLEHLLQAIEEELGGWRARCLKAEQDLAAAPTKGKVVSGSSEVAQARQRIGLLEGENQDLRRRITRAREHVERLSTRLSFVEEHGAGGAG